MAHDHQGRPPTYSTYSTGPDTLGLAEEAVRAGLISQDVLDHLTSLHPQVPNSMKHRYLLKHMHDTLNADDELFTRVVQVFLKFQSHSLPATSPGSKGDDFPLQTEHIPVLTELLINHAYKWKFLGTALRFTPEDLDNIHSSLVAVLDLPKECLLKLLQNWVRRANKHTLAPTVSALETALKSHTVGLGVLVSELRTCITRSRDQSASLCVQNQALPYFVASLSIREHECELDATVSYSPRYRNRIEAKESGSVLLEIQVASETPAKTTYQWLMNEQALVETEGYTGTSSPILCISNVDVDMDGAEYSCIVDVNSREFAIKTKPVTLRVNSELDQYTPSLVSLYSSQPEIPQDTWPPVGNKKYINLAIIKQEQVNYSAEYTHLTIRGDMDDILQHKEMVKYDEVFKIFKSKKLLFIEGRPGSGKTTFVHKITRDWANTPKGAIRLLLLVSLKVLNNLNKPKLDLADILNLFKDLKVSKETLEGQNGKFVCFIFDGFDEYSPPDGKDSIVHKIINKEYLSHCTIIVASRPAAVAEMRGRADGVIEVLGFKREQIHEYFDYYPFSISSKSEDLKNYLSSHPNILHMCYLPIHAAMVAFLFEKTGRVPKTETEIYRHFTNFTLKRNFTKYSPSQRIDVHNLSGEEKKLFTQICKLALDKTILNKQVLHQDEVDLVQPNYDRDITLGLITIDRTAGLYGFEDIYGFLHPTFQEYLAAYHISTLSDEKQHQLIQEHGDKNHMLVVCKFLCGLTKFGVKSTKFKVMLKKTVGKVLFQIQCAYESQQSITCTQILKNTNYLLEFSCQYLTVPEFHAIGYVLSKSVLPTSLSIVQCKGNFNVEAMCNLLEQARTNLRELDLSENNLGEESAKILASSLKNCRKLERVVIHGNGIPFNGVLAIFEAIKDCNLRVNTDDVTTKNYIELGGFLVHILKFCTNLQSLTILQDTNIINFPFLSENWKSLKELRLLSGKNVAEIAYSIGNDYSQLETLLLNNFKFGSGASNFAKGLSHCFNLQTLDLTGSKQLYAAGIKAIAAGLCISIKYLFLNNCRMNDEGAMALSDCLKRYQNLSVLGLHTNEIGDAGTRALASQLQYCTKLELLDFYDNDITGRRARSIMSTAQQETLVIRYIATTVSH